MAARLGRTRGHGDRRPPDRDGPAPPDATRRVSVSLSLTARLAGVIEGISWPQQDIPISGVVGWVALTKATHALSALFSHGVQSVPIVDESGIVTGWEDRVFAQVRLLGVS